MNNKKFYTATFRNTTVHIPLEHIYYFEVYKRRVTLYSKEYTEGFYFNSTIKKVQEELDNLDAGFIKVHQSYLININQIFKLEKDSVVLFNGKEIPISRTRKTELREKFMKEQTTAV